jgi:hypothetical protein
LVVHGSPGGPVAGQEDIMRATLDKLISWTGLLLALVLLVAGSLLMWGSTFINNEVDKQLSDQKIVMPTDEEIKADESLSDEDKKALEKHAGSDMNTGAEAKAYADNYILPHTMAATGGETYATLGDKQSEVCPPRGSADEPSEECQQVTGQRNTAQLGSTLRGLLLYGYAFATMGTIAGIAAWAAFAAALLFLVLGVLGLRHASKVNSAA